MSFRDLLDKFLGSKLRLLKMQMWRDEVHKLYDSIHVVINLISECYILHWNQIQVVTSRRGGSQLEFWMMLIVWWMTTKKAAKTTFFCECVHTGRNQ